MGGAPPPRTGFARGTYPTSLPLCNTIVVICPTFLELWPSNGVKCLQNRGVAGGTDVRTKRPRTRRTACNAPDCRPSCAPAAVAPTLGCMPRAAAPRSHLPSRRWSPGAAAEALRAVTIRRVPSRRTPRSTSTRPCGPRASCATTRSRRPARCWARSDPQAKIDELVATGVRGVRAAEARLRARREAVARREGRAVGGDHARRRVPRGVIASATDDGGGAGGDRPRREGQREAFTQAQLRGRRLPGEREGRRRHRRATSWCSAPRRSSSARSTRPRATGSPRTTASRRRPTTSTTTGSGRSTSTSRRCSTRRRARTPRPRSSSSRSRALFPFDKVGPVAGEFLADGERLAVDAAADVPEGSAAGSLGALHGRRRDAAAGRAARRLVGGARLAEARPDAQARLPAGGAARSAARRSSSSCARSSGSTSQEDVFSWVGDVAFFARGTTMDSIEGGAVIEVTDPAKAKAAFGKLIGLAQSRAALPTKPIRIEGAETGVRGRAARRAEVDRRGARRGPRGDRLRARGGGGRALPDGQARRQRHLLGGEVRARRRRRAGLPDLHRRP